MPSAALQKLASGLSSSGAGVTDQSFSNSTRSGGGVIRGLLQSLRAGLSTESGSPRSSRNGLGDLQASSRGTYSQQALLTSCDILRVDSDVSDAEDFRTRLLSSGPSGFSYAPVIPKTHNSGALDPIVLNLEGSLAASRTSDVSGRQSGQGTPARLASSARPSFESPRTETSDLSSRASFAGPISVSGPTSVFDTTKITSALLPQLPPTPSPAITSPHVEALTQRPKETVWSASASTQSPPKDSQEPQPVSKLSNSCEALPKHPQTDAPGPPGIQPSKLSARLRSLKPYIRRHFLQMHSSSRDRPPKQAKHPDKDTDGSSWDGSSYEGDGGEGGGAASSITAVINASNNTLTDNSIARGAPVLDTVECEQRQQDQQDDDQQDLNQQEEQQQQQQRHCRSASTNTLSAMLVSQAVHRLQLRQQQERAAVRYSRSSLPLPISVAGGNSGGGIGLHHQYVPQQAIYGLNPREVAAAASTQRVLSVASDSGGAAPTIAAGAAEKGSSCAQGGEAGAVGMSQSPQVHQQPQPSLARTIGLGMTQSRPFVNSAAFQSSVCEAYRSPVDSGVGAAACGFEDWLGDVSDVSRGRTARTSRPDWERRSSLSYTEGHVNAAERLQVMVNSAASAGGDEAASYLQQLLIPDLPSTASVDLQYSNASTRVPSVVALAYGSSSGAVAAGALVSSPSLVPAVGGLWGQLHGSSSPPAVSEACPPGSRAASGGAAAGCSGGQVRHLSAQGHPMYSDHAWLGGSSGPSSRHGSGVINCSTTPLLCGVSQSYSSAAVCALGGSVTSGSVTNAMLDGTTTGGTTDTHDNKTAVQLVEELRELCTAPVVRAASATFKPSPAHRATRRASTGAVAAGEDMPPNGQGFGGSEVDGHAATAAKMERSTQMHHQHQHQHRDELISALWRLLRSKDSDAVSYLLAVDPACKSNRAIAPMLKEMRSWVYLNMW